MAQTLIVDTDIHGVNDDAFALHYLFTHGHTPSMITTCSGNSLASDSARDAQSLLGAYGTRLPGGVQPGPDQPTGWTSQIRKVHKATRRELATTVHLGELGSNRALTSPPMTQSIDYAACPPEADIAYLALGPLGNLSNAIDAGLLDPARIEHLVFSGGAFTVPGNVGPFAEFNIFADPLAAANVLRSGLRRITFVPLDVTAKVTYGLTEFERIATFPSIFGEDLGRTKQKVFRDNSDFREPIWDLVAAIVMHEPEVIVRSLRATVTVECMANENIGATSMLPPVAESIVDVVLEVDEDTIRKIMCECASGRGR